MKHDSRKIWKIEEIIYNRYFKEKIIPIKIIVLYLEAILTRL